MYNNPIFPTTTPLNWISGLTYSNTALLPRASSVKEVDEMPITTLNSEQVYLNKDDDTIMYIKRVDSTGKTTTTRYRFYEDAEPTQQQINAIQGFNNLGLQITNQTNQLSGQIASLNSKLDSCCCEIKTQMLQYRLDDANAKIVAQNADISNMQQSQYILNQLGRFVAWTPSGTQATSTNG